MRRAIITSKILFSIYFLEASLYVIIFLNSCSVVYCDCGMIDASYLLTPNLINIVYIDGNTETGSEAVFSCPRGYDLYGTGKTQCDGDWYVPDKPKCVEVKCPAPNNIPHGHMHFVSHNSLNEFTFGSAYSVECETGYVIIGAPVRTCLENGSWSGESFDCIGTDLVDLSIQIANGRIELVKNPDIKEKNKNKTVCYVLCNSGYRVNGSSVIECDENVVALNDSANCIRDHDFKECSELPHAVDNGRLQVTKHPQYPVFYTIECDEGYFPGKSAVLACQSDGNWSVKAPYCKRNLRIDTSAVTVTIIFLLVICIIVVTSILIIKRLHYRISCIRKNADAHQDNEHMEPLNETNLITDVGAQLEDNPLIVNYNDQPDIDIDSVLYGGSGELIPRPSRRTVMCQTFDDNNSLINTKQLKEAYTQTCVITTNVSDTQTQINFDGTRTSQPPPSQPPVRPSTTNNFPVGEAREDGYNYREAEEETREASDKMHTKVLPSGYKRLAKADIIQDPGGKSVSQTI